MDHLTLCKRVHTAIDRFERKDGSGLSHLECGLLELKFSGADEKDMEFECYGAVFGNVDSYGDVIEKGAFRTTIAEAKSSGRWPAMLSQHGGLGLTAQDLTPIGVWLDMHEDDLGLFMKGKFAPTPRGIEMYTLMKMKPRPALDGFSIGYRAIKWKMRSTPDEPRRTLQEVALREVSPVTFPANGKALLQSAKQSTGKRLAEEALRDAGFSQAEAKAIVAKGFPSQQRQREVGGLGDLAASLRQTIDALK